MVARARKHPELAPVIIQRYRFICRQGWSVHRLTYHWVGARLDAWEIYAETQEEGELAGVFDLFPYMKVDETYSLRCWLPSACIHTSP